MVVHEQLGPVGEPLLVSPQTHPAGTMGSTVPLAGEEREGVGGREGGRGEGGREGKK